MVSKKALKLIAILMIATLSLAACAKATPTQDPSMKITEIASTVMAEMTLTAQAMPSATPTATPTVTPEPATSTPMGSPTATMAVITPITGDNVKWDADITIPDGTMVKPGATFEKTWSVQNTGTTTWTTEYQLIYLEGPQATTLFVKLAKAVAPGELAQITVKFVAPETKGMYTGWWQLVSASGYRFGEQLSVIFNVGTETPTPTSSATTPTVTVTATTETP